MKARLGRAEGLVVRAHKLCRIHYDVNADGLTFDDLSSLTFRAYAVGGTFNLGPGDYTILLGGANYRLRLRKRQRIAA